MKKVYLMILVLFTVFLVSSCGDDDSLTQVQAGTKLAEIYCNLGPICEGEVNEDYNEKYSSMSECIDDNKKKSIPYYESCKSWNDENAYKCLLCVEKNTSCDNIFEHGSPFCEEECGNICK